MDRGRIPARELDHIGDDGGQLVGLFDEIGQQRLAGAGFDVPTRQQHLDVCSQAGNDFGATSSVLGVCIGYLRRKTEEQGERRLLHTVRGVGYILRDDEQ